MACLSVSAPSTTRRYGMATLPPLLFALLALLAVSGHVVAASDQAALDRDLEAAARGNDAEAARRAIAAGAALNAKGAGGQTPLMAATLAGSTEVVR